MQDIRDRIIHLMKTKNINATQLSEILEVQRSGISHILSGRNKPSTDFMIKLKESFPEFSLDWLMLGKGPATISPPAVEVSPSQVRQNALQPSLFDFVEKNEPVAEEKEVQKTGSNIDNVQNRNKETIREENTPSGLKKENPPAGQEDSKKIVRLIFVYDDNTFSVLNAAD